MVRTELILYWSLSFSQEIHRFEMEKSHAVSQMSENGGYRVTLSPDCKHAAACRISARGPAAAGN
jgi:hypothetical protein